MFSSIQKILRKSPLFRLTDFTKSTKNQQKFLELQNTRRNFETAQMKEVCFGMRNVLSTGLAHPSLKLYEFPWKEQPDPKKNIVRNSFLRAVLPFNKSKELSELFVRFDTDKIRIGKLLEIMDLMSGHVCYTHLKIL